MNMNMKQKLIRQKQNVDRPLGIYKNSQPLIVRLESQYLFNQPLGGSKGRLNRMNQKENVNVGNNRLCNEYVSHNVIQIDNYENKKFKTQQGFEPMMTKSRFMGEQGENIESFAVYGTEQNVVFRKEKIRKNLDRMYDSVDMIQNQRPLTFGLVRKVQPLKNSVQYRQDIKMKNEILNEINLGKSQQSMLGSKDFSVSGFVDNLRCVNHSNKKAKYRLIGEEIELRDEEMIYCSKCAINLLQQGFKVEEMKIDVPLSCGLAKSQQNFVGFNSMMNSVGGSSTRLQEMRNFEGKLNETEMKVSEVLQRSACETQNIEQLQRQIWQTQTIFDSMIGYLQQEKKARVDGLNDKKNKRISQYNRRVEELKEELESIGQMKREMKEYRNRFIIMRQNEFRFLLNSFGNRIQNYGRYFEEIEIMGIQGREQVDGVIQGLRLFVRDMEFVEDEVNCQNGGQRNRNDDQFVCREIKGPFRTLFPEEGSERKGNQEDSPSFSKCHNDTFETMQRSLQNSQQSRF